MIPYILDQHKDEASGLISLRRDALRSQAFRFRDLSKLDKRLDANWDGLRLGGRAAVELCRASLEDDPQCAAIIAVLLLELRDDLDTTVDEVLAILRSDNPEIRDWACLGLKLAQSYQVGRVARKILLSHSSESEKTISLHLLAFHRLLEPKQYFLLEGSNNRLDDKLECLRIESIGRSSGAETFLDLFDSLDHRASTVRRSVLCAAARRQAINLRSLCLDAAGQLNATTLEALQFLGVLGVDEDLDLLKRAAGNQVTASAAIEGIGQLGSLSGIPFLLEIMEIPSLMSPASNAFERITGLNVELSKPEQEDDQFGSREELVEIGTQPEVDHAAARKWWSANESRFDPEKRYQMGLCVSDDPLGEVFDQLPLNIRQDVYLRQRALVPGTPDWELETWSWKQRNPGG